MHYNICADCYTTPKHTELNHTYAKNFKTRSAMIIKQLRESNADIVNLNEVDHIDDCYGPALTEMGYEFHYEVRNEKDATLIAYKKSKFECLKSQAI